MNLSKKLPEKALRGLVYFLQKYTWLFSAAVAFQLLNVGCGMLINLIIREYTDNLIVASTSEYPFWLYLLLFGILALIQGGSAFMGGKMNSRTSESITRELRNRLFDHIQRLSFTYHDTMRTGELIQRVTSDVHSLNRFYGMQLIQMARIFFMFIINWGVIMYLDRRLGLVSIITIPFIAGLSIVFFTRISRAFESYQVQDARVSTIIQENLSGVRVVKAFARQAFEIDKFNVLNDEKQRLGRKFVLSHAAYWPASHFLCAAQMVAGISYAAYLVFTDQITLGTLMAFTGMSAAITWPLQNLGRVIADLSTAFVSYRRISDILNEDPEEMEEGRKSKQRLSGKITCTNLAFSYTEGQHALHNINFSCEAGEKIALIGEPGSGKTSFINLLPRFYEISGGELTIDGAGIQSYTKQYLREQIGIVEQQPFLFSASIKENIAYAVHGDPTEEEIINAARMASIADSIEGFPDKYETMVGEKGVTLSGGQKQRIAIARTILKDPAILILDDSTSAVDSETEMRIKEALSGLMKGRTTFIIAHRLSSVLDADQILVFKDGTIIQQGTHQTLMNEDGFYRTVFTLQSQIENDLQKEIENV